MRSDTRYTPEILRETLAEIAVRASSRGRGGTLSLDEARDVIDALVVSDEAPEWKGVREDDAGSVDRLRTIVGLIREGEATRRRERVAEQMIVRGLVDPAMFEPNSPDEETND